MVHDHMENEYMVPGPNHSVRCALGGKECRITKDCLRCGAPDRYANLQLASELKQHTKALRAYIALINGRDEDPLAETSCPASPSEVRP